MEKRLLLYNGHIATFHPANSFANSLYLEDGKIRAIGEFRDLQIQFGRHDVLQIDLQGGYVYPGLVDNHCHLSAVGMKLSMLDFSEVRSKQEMLALLRDKVQKTKAGEWVLGLNWNENQFADKAIPTIQELDEIAPNHPVLLTRTCYHVNLANSAAFQRAGIGPNTPAPEGGAFGRDSQGSFNGLVYETASLLFHQAQPKPTYSQRKEFVRKGMEHALSKGLTGVHTEDLRYLGNISEMLGIYRELIEEGYALRSHHLIYYPHLQELDELGLTTGSGDDWLKIGALKIFADGAIGGRTALLSAPYADDPSMQGMAIHSQDSLNQLTEQARKRRMPIAVHAIGDLAAEMVITSMETHPVEDYVDKQYRDRLIHAQVLRRDLIERLQKLHVVIDIQPRFVASDFPWVMERLGSERLQYAYAWRKLIDAGLKCGGGSDAPIEPIDPLLGIHAAITRRNPADQEHEGYLPAERLTAREALDLFTLGSVYTEGEELRRGSIAVGKQADLSIFDQDLIHSHPDEILKAKTLMTITNGRIGFSQISE